MIAEVAVHDVGAGMDVADDALAGRDGVARCEAMLDRMARLVLGNGRVGGVGCRRGCRNGVRAGVDRRAIVGVDDVAGGAAAGAIVAGMVVGAEEVERRIEQARLLQADEDRDRCGSRCPGRGC